MRVLILIIFFSFNFAGNAYSQNITRVPQQNTARAQLCERVTSRTVTLITKLNENNQQREEAINKVITKIKSTLGKLKSSGYNTEKVQLNLQKVEVLTEKISQNHAKSIDA